MQSQLQTLKKQVDLESIKLEERERNKSIALGTSRINYMDPRITISWCKNEEVPIEKIYQKNLQSKFAWAMDSDLDWKF